MCLQPKSWSVIEIWTLWHCLLFGNELTFFVSSRDTHAQTHICMNGWMDMFVLLRVRGFNLKHKHNSRHCLLVDFVDLEIFPPLMLITVSFLFRSLLTVRLSVGDWSSAESNCCIRSGKKTKTNKQPLNWSILPLRQTKSCVCANPNIYTYKMTNNVKIFYSHTHTPTNTNKRVTSETEWVTYWLEAFHFERLDRSQGN